MESIEISIALGPTVAKLSNARRNCAYRIDCFPRIAPPELALFPWNVECRSCTP